MHRNHRPGPITIYLTCLALLGACTNDNDRPIDPRAEILVTVDWLAAHLDDPDLVLLHVGDSADYAAEHIRGAHHVTRDQVSQPRSSDPEALTLELPNPDDLERLLESFGVSNDSRIVVYWGGEWVSQTTRVLFTLDWAGLGSQAALLDGGLEAWQDAGHPTTDQPARAATANLTLSPRPELVVDADWVSQHATPPGFALVDARAPEHYSGEREDRGKAGHIPGAGSTHWMAMVDDSLRLRSAEEMAEILAAAGVQPADTVVAYCHIGQYATVVLFAARTLGHEVRLFDGSFQDWAARDLPVVPGITR